MSSHIYWCIMGSWDTYLWEVVPTMPACMQTLFCAQCCVTMPALVASLCVACSCPGLSSSSPSRPQSTPGQWDPIPPVLRDHGGQPQLGEGPHCSKEGGHCAQSPADTVPHLHTLHVWVDTAATAAAAADNFRSTTALQHGLWNSRPATAYVDLRYAGGSERVLAGGSTSSRTCKVRKCCAVYWKMSQKKIPDFVKNQRFLAKI